MELSFCCCYHCQDMKTKWKSTIAEYTFIDKNAEKL